MADIAPENKPDCYGIPPWMFGAMPDELPASIGRVVMVAALLEEKLLNLAWVLTAATQDQYVDKSVAQVLQICRDGLKGLDAELAAQGAELLNDIEASLWQRNDIVHSLWPDPTRQRMWGWRHTNPKHVDGQQTTKTITTSDTQLLELISHLVTHVHATIHFHSTAGNHLRSRATP